MEYSSLSPYALVFPQNRHKKSTSFKYSSQKCWFQSWTLSCNLLPEIIMLHSKYPFPRRIVRDITRAHPNLKPFQTRPLTHKLLWIQSKPRLSFRRGKKRDHLKDLVVDGRILEWILAQYGGKVWTERIWLRIGKSGWILWTR